MQGEELRRNQVREDELEVAGRILVAHLVCAYEELFGGGVIFFEEGDDAGVVFEGNLMRLWECRERRHVCARDFERAQDVFGERDGVEAEVGFEEEVGDVVEGPFAGVFE